MELLLTQYPCSRLHCHMVIKNLSLTRWKPLLRFVYSLGNISLLNKPVGIYQLSIILCSYHPRQIEQFSIGMEMVNSSITYNYINMIHLTHTKCYPEITIFPNRICLDTSRSRALPRVFFPHFHIYPPKKTTRYYSRSRSIREKKCISAIYNLLQDIKPISWDKTKKAGKQTLQSLCLTRIGRLP